MAHSEEVAGDKTASLGQGTEKKLGTVRQVAEWQPCIYQPVKEWRGASQATGTAWLPGEGDSKLETGAVKRKGLGSALHQGTMLTGQRPGDLQHHTRSLCRLMDRRSPYDSWNRLTTRSVLTFHAMTVPSRLQE